MKFDKLMPEQVVARYTLKKPYMYAGEKVYQLEFREPIAKDYLEVEKESKDCGMFEMSLKLLQKLSHSDPGIIENLSQTDLQGALEVIQPFLEISSTTTKTT